MKVLATFITLFVFLLGGSSSGHASQSFVRPALCEQHYGIPITDTDQFLVEQTIDDRDAGLSAAADLISVDEDDDDDDTNTPTAFRFIPPHQTNGSTCQRFCIDRSNNIGKTTSTSFDSTLPRYLVQQVFRL